MCYSCWLRLFSAKRIPVHVYIKTYLDIYMQRYQMLPFRLQSLKLCWLYFVSYNRILPPTGQLVLMEDVAFRLSCCGVIKRWIFHASKTGQVDFQIWRYAGNTYTLIGQNSYTVPGVCYDKQ